MIVLVCGGRNYLDKATLYRELDALDGVKCLVSGGAQGADSLAVGWAKARGVNSVVYHADWEKHGRAAGPIRNQEMLIGMKPDLIMAFAGGRGTADMVRRGLKATVTVIEVSQPALQGRRV